jgi:phospholipid N-methyltransferase
MLKKRAAFFKQFLKKGNRNGSITPSSIFLCRKMISTIDFSHARCIVELGPGEGAITREIVKKMGPQTQLLLFEMNKEFVDDFLQFDDPRIHAINDSAEFISKYLKEYHIDKVDYIISSLPLSLFPDDLQHKILDESQRVLRPRGIYMQYMYFTDMAEAFKRHFQNVKRNFVPLNIPPAFVYTCHK